jgi:hypothetical protein
MGKFGDNFREREISLEEIEEGGRKRNEKLDVTLILLMIF